ncbi:MAG: DUF2244 domain-containing protein [Neomegalonema sp.]|nr:DUF2244 domain-containing protein [Neomegalonema sp.]
MSDTTIDTLTSAEGEEPLLRYTLWPHRSLSVGGFRIVMAVSAVLMSVPLYGIIGTTAFWFVGAFILIDLLLLYGLIGLTYRSGRVREVVELWPDRLRIERIEPSGKRKSWEANPHWVRVDLHDTRKHPSYLVLSSAGRHIELGAFLTPAERRSLADELRIALAQARTVAASTSGGNS